MKCPKCGYNSFDHLDSCKKCGKDLAEHKARFNIQSILLSEMPAEAMSSIAEEAVAAATEAPDVAIDDFSGSTSETDADDFGFDFMGDSEDEENLAFDELFEEVPAEDEVEEALEAPDMEEGGGAEESAAEPFTAPEPEPVPLDQELTAEETAFEAEKPAAADEFSFDETESIEEPADVASESPAEFGFDSDDDPDADIFAETEEDFSLDGTDFDEPDKG